ncbi:MAG: hypothetical protein KKA48_05730, partial [Proteobacteria bacterium]|nr:hypothetical protein [Pseudomonadota bacterium]
AMANVADMTNSADSAKTKPQSPFLLINTDLLSSRCLMLFPPQCIAFPETIRAFTIDEAVMPF